MGIAELLASQVVAEQSGNGIQLEKAKQALVAFMPSLKGKQVGLLAKVSNVGYGCVNLCSIDIHSKALGPSFSIEFRTYPKGPLLEDPDNKEEVRKWAEAYVIKRYGSVGEYKAPNPDFFVIGDDIGEDVASRLVFGDLVDVNGTISHWEIIGNKLVIVYVCDCSIKVR